LKSYNSFSNNDFFNSSNALFISSLRPWRTKSRRKEIDGKVKEGGTNDGRRERKGARDGERRDKRWKK
jgi:hypothetical protein